MAETIPVSGETKPPASGISLARTGEEAAFLRRRLERPARLGRYVLAFFGAVTIGAGIADYISTGSKIGLAFGAFGAVLVVLGAVQHVLHRRDLAHWPSDVLLWNEGIELVLANGEVRGATWNDARLALQLVARRAPLPAKREYLLLWLSDSKVPAVELSPEGFERLLKVSGEAGLRLSQNRKGSRADSTQMILIEKVAPPDLGETKPVANPDG